MPTRPAVVIAGGGPVGLVVALMLGRAGIAVTLFDQGDIVHSQPRAATIHPATLDILDDLGAYALIEPQGIVCPIVNYYDGKLKLASFDHALLKDETRHPWVLQCEQDKLSRTLFAMAKAISNITFRTATEVVGCRERDDAVEVLVEAVDGRQERHQALYLVGADGARSAIRKAIGIEFEGFTYPERCMIIGTPYDFAADGYAYRNYIADPQEWYNLFKISWQGPPGIYRLVVPLRPDEPLDGDRALTIAQRKLQRFNPRARSYEVAFYDSYTVAQRVAATFRKGRVLRGEENDAALDRYVRQRRHVATGHVQTATIANKQNMEQRDPVKRQRFRDEMRRRAEDPVLAKAFLMRTALIDSLRDAEKIA